MIQTLQILKSNVWSGTRAVEFHAYAVSGFLDGDFDVGVDVSKGKEAGMLGLAQVASQYKSAGKKVRAMLQLDMIGKPSLIPAAVALNLSFL